MTKQFSRSAGAAPRGGGKPERLRPAVRTASRSASSGPVRATGPAAPPSLIRSRSTTAGFAFSGNLAFALAALGFGILLLLAWRFGPANANPHSYMFVGAILSMFVGGWAGANELGLLSLFGGDGDGDGAAAGDGGD